MIMNIINYTFNFIRVFHVSFVTGMGSPTPVGNNNMLPPAMPSPMPQLILASGQLVQGIQGAQLLIPTSQGRY